MLLAMVLFGLMATFSKDVLTHGSITGPQLVAFRVIGAALLFWLGSLVVPQQRIERRDFLKIAGAGFFGFALAQGGYIVGLSFTSPINATIELTTMPIFTLILSFFVLSTFIFFFLAASVLDEIAFSFEAVEEKDCTFFDTSSNN